MRQWSFNRLRALLVYKMETGRSRPSREMVLLLSEVLDVPPRAKQEQNLCHRHQRTAGTL